MIVQYDGGQYELSDKFVLPLNTICHNLNRGWDFVILCTSSGYGRAGKSTFMGQIANFCARRLGTPFNIENFVFGSNAMINTALKLPPMSVIINDESREDLSSKRFMESMSKEIMDFFNECGVLNHLYILLATDFFDFNPNIAKTRSEMLFNLSRKYGAPYMVGDMPTIDIERGHVQYFDRIAKAQFYDFCKPNKNYNDASKYAVSEISNFPDTWVVDKEEYDKRKRAFLGRHREFKPDTTKNTYIQPDFYKRLYDNWIRNGYTETELSEKTGITVWALRKNLERDKNDGEQFL